MLVDGDTGEGDVVDDVDQEFGFCANTDDAILGHEALAALGLLLDCRTWSLVDGPRPSTWISKRTALRVPVEFSHPANPSRCAVVPALVDSGCTDCDLRQRVIGALSLPVDESEGTAHFET